MSAVNPVLPTSNTNPVAPVVSSPTSAAAAASAGSVDFSNVASLAQTSPALWQAMLQGMAMNEIQYMQDAEATREQMDQEQYDED